MWPLYQFFIRIGLLFYYTSCFVQPIYGKCDDLPSSIKVPKIKTHTLSQNERYLFAVHENSLCVKKRKQDSSWKHIGVPPGLKHNVKEISVDGAQLAALNTQNQVFFMRHALGGLNTFIWTARWGVPLGFGNGLWLSPTITFWDFSFLSPKLDRSYVDSAGQNHIIGFGVSTLFAVGEDKQQIFYFDPWLPSDTSQQVCGPMRGTLRIAALSTLGSTLAAMDQYGNIFLRRYDFDFAGGDRGIMGYTYKNKKPSNNFFVWLRGARKLPVPDWEKLPKIKGTITNRISLERIGHGAKVRLVRVEGIRKNRTGYFEAKFDFIKRSPDLSFKKAPIIWRFYPTHEPLKGTIIDNRNLASLMDIGIGKDRFLTTTKSDFPKIELVNFNTYCSPALMKVYFADHEKPLELYVHHRETLRVTKKSPNSTLKQRGRIEVPEEILNKFDELPNAQRMFINSYLRKKRFTKINLHVSPKKVKITLFTFPMRRSWTFSPLNDDNMSQ